MTTTPSFTLEPRGPFSLEPLRTMACGFLRGTRACALDGAIRIAFPKEGSFEIVGAKIRPAESGVHVDVFGSDDRAAIEKQIARTLGLDHDADEFARVVDRDPALARAFAEAPGFRPVVAYSPYVMAGWCVLSQRISMAQAAKIQVRLSTACGDVAVIEGESVASFPRPQSILARSHFEGIPAEKWARLHAVAHAALDGVLDAKNLTALSYEDATTALRKIHGIGAWSADGILIRGTGATDLLPLSEPALHRAIEHAYDFAHPPSDADVIRMAESWRPFRTWASVLLMYRSGFRAGKTGEITSRGRRPRRRSGPSARSAQSRLLV